MTKDFDVIVYGTVCLDRIWRVESLAAPGSYESILEARTMLGGEAANTAVALSRWGVRVALVGTATGDDEDGATLRLLLNTDASDVNIDGLDQIPGVQTPYCVCIATPDGHRTMYGSGFTDMQCPELDPAFARRARLFTMEPNAFQAGIAAARVAAAAGLDIVAMDYTSSPEVNRASTIAVTSHERLNDSTNLQSAADHAERVRETDGCTTIVTCGHNGCFVADRDQTGQSAYHIPAYVVEDVIDSTGAGDIFRAGLIFGQLKGWNLSESARFASAAAALNCSAMGGWGGVQTVPEITAFQKRTPTRPTKQANNR